MAIAEDNDMQPPKDFHDDDDAYCWEPSSPARDYLITAGFLVFMCLALYGLGALLGVAP